MVEKRTSPHEVRTGATISPDSSNFSSHLVTAFFSIVKAMDGLLWSFYSYCRYTVSAQYVGDTITKRVRYNQQPGLEIRSHQNWNHCLPMHPSPPRSTWPAAPHSV